MAIGQALHGLVDPFMLIPALPEMTEAVLKDFSPEDQEVINDLSSGIFNCFLGLGQIAGPLFGSIMTSQFGFRLSADFVSIIIGIFAIVYFVFGEGSAAFKVEKEQENQFKDEISTSQKENLLSSQE